MDWNFELVQIHLNKFYMELTEERSIKTHRHWLALYSFKHINTI